MTSADIALLISGLALGVSILTLWMTHFAPFKLKILHDSPTFCLYKITPAISGSEENRTWWIPSFDVGMSLYNAGRRTGEIFDIRIVAELKEFRNTKKCIFYPKWIVDYKIFSEHRTSRFKWIEKAIIRDWYPILLKGHSDISLHIIFEGDRWEHEEQGEMVYNIEAISSRPKKWVQLGRYTMTITKDMFEGKSCYTSFDKKIEDLRKL